MAEWASVWLDMFKSSLPLRCSVLLPQPPRHLCNTADFLRSSCFWKRLLLCPLSYDKPSLQWSRRSTLQKSSASGWSAMQTARLLSRPEPDLLLVSLSSRALLPQRLQCLPKSPEDEGTHDSTYSVSFMAYHIVGCTRLLGRYRNRLIDFQISNINGKEHVQKFSSLEIKILSSR